MIQGVDRVLEQRLERRRGTSVHSDPHGSTGLSQPFALDWVKRASEQAQALRPDVTAMFIGADDDFPIITPEGGTAACCAAGWVAEYSRRVEAMMRTYLRDARSLVYWMTLPAPRRRDLARIYRGLNVAIRLAAARVGGGVRLLDLVPAFTPDDRFRQNVTLRGRTVSARHATASGCRRPARRSSRRSWSIACAPRTRCCPRADRRRRRGCGRDLGYAARPHARARADAADAHRLSRACPSAGRSASADRRDRRGRVSPRRAGGRRPRLGS